MPSSPAATYCDDGDTSNGNGCSSTCTVEPKWSCSGGNTGAPALIFVEMAL